VLSAESSLSNPGTDQQHEVDGVAKNAHDAVAVDINGRNYSQHDANQREKNRKQTKKRPPLIGFFIKLKKEEKRQKKKISPDAPYRNRDTRKNGIRALRDRVTIQGTTDCTKALITEIREITIVGQGQVNR
jgi:hypothetical protein